MSNIGTEQSAVQNLLIHYADEAGWTYIPISEALSLRKREGKRRQEP